MPDYCLGKTEKLTKRAEYNRVLRRGRRHHSPHFSLIVTPGRAGRRLGVIVSRRVGSAVKRNRAKRLIREFFRLNKEAFPAGESIIIGKKGAAELSYHEAAAELERLLARGPGQKTGRKR